MIKKAWQRITNMGIWDGLNPHLAKRVKLTNQVVSFITAMAFCYIFIFYFIGLHKEAVEVFFITIAFSIPLLLNRFRLYFFARLWFLFVLNGAIVVYTFLFGKEAGIQYGFLSSICLPWLFFSTRDWIYILFSSLLPVVLFFVFSLFPIVAITPLSPQVQHIILLALQGSVFGSTTVCLAFLSMQNSLSERSLAGTNEVLQRTQLQLEQASVLNNGLVAFGEVSRNNNKSLEQLCTSCLDYLHRKFDCGYGALMVYDKYEDTIVLVAETGGNEGKNRRLHIKPGTGLAGDAFMRNKKIRIADMPGDYLYTIKSGLGKRAPKNLLVMPLLFKGQKAGVLELATFSTFNDTDLRILDAVSEELAAGILTLKNEMDMLTFQSRSDARIKDQQEIQQRQIKEFVMKSKEKEISLMNEIADLKKQL